MKIKNLLANVVAILTVITLIGGFQINAAEQVTTVVETVAGVDEAYAGPCGDAGCVGPTTEICRTYNVFNIFNLRLERTCRGILLADPEEEASENDTPAESEIGSL